MPALMVPRAYNIAIALFRDLSWLSRKFGVAEGAECQAAVWKHSESCRRTGGVGFTT